MKTYSDKGITEYVSGNGELLLLASFSTTFERGQLIIFDYKNETRTPTVGRDGKLLFKGFSPFFQCRMEFDFKNGHLTYTPASPSLKELGKGGQLVDLISEIRIVSIIPSMLFGLYSLPFANSESIIVPSEVELATGTSTRKIRYNNSGYIEEIIRDSVQEDRSVFLSGLQLTKSTSSYNTKILVGEHRWEE